MRERPDDIRVTKTIRAIHAEFERMLCEIGYDEITVRELCARVPVNKNTFYRYYETLDFLLAEFQEEMMVDYLKRVEGLSIPEDLDQITHEFFKYANERGEVFEKITCAASNRALQTGMEAEVLDRHGSTNQEDYGQSLLTSFVTDSTLALYRKWVSDGKPIPIEELADVVSALVCHGVDALINSSALAS